MDHGIEKPTKKRHSPEEEGQCIFEQQEEKRSQDTDFEFALLRLPMARYSATAYPQLPPLTLPIEDAVHSGAAGAAVHSGPALWRTPS